MRSKLPAQNSSEQTCLSLSGGHGHCHQGRSWQSESELRLETRHLIPKAGVFLLRTSQGNSASFLPMPSPPLPSSPILWQDERAAQKDSQVHWDSEASVCLLVPVEGEGQCPAPPLGNSWLWALVPSWPLPKPLCRWSPPPDTHTLLMLRT